MTDEPGGQDQMRQALNDAGARRPENLKRQNKTTYAYKKEELEQPGATQTKSQTREK